MAQQGVENRKQGQSITRRCLSKGRDTKAKKIQRNKQELELSIPEPNLNTFAWPFSVM